MSGSVWCRRRARDSSRSRPTRRVGKAVGRQRCRACAGRLVVGAGRPSRKVIFRSGMLAQRPRAWKWRYSTASILVHLIIGVLPERNAIEAVAKGRTGYTGRGGSVRRREHWCLDRGARRVVRSGTTWRFNEFALANRQQLAKFSLSFRVFLVEVVGVRVHGLQTYADEANLGIDVLDSCVWREVLHGETW